MTKRRRTAPLLAGSILGLSVVFGAVSPAWAQGAVTAQTVSEQQCGDTKAPPLAWVVACSQIINGGSVLGPELAKAYAHRGHAHTMLRNLQRASEDLADRLEGIPTEVAA